MTTLTKIVFGLFVAALPFCYWTAAPACLGALIFILIYGEECFVRIMRLEHERELEKHFDKIEKQVQEHQTAINSLNLKLGMGPLPPTK